jgi:hypothetical protein
MMHGFLQGLSSNVNGMGIQSVEQTAWLQQWQSTMVPGFSL